MLRQMEHTKFRNKTFAALLIALFLGLQSFSLLHMADFGFAEHDHDGQICDIYLLSEQNKFSDTPTDAPSFSATYKPETPSFGTKSTWVKEARKSALARAPPAFLQS
jgi:hypothetical protein